jgi:hypothetical protein
LQKTERNSLLKQYDNKSKQYSWRQGLSHFLRITRPNNNNILKNKTSNGKCNSTTDTTCRTTANNTTAVVADSPKCRSTDTKGMHTDTKCTRTETKCNSTEMKVLGTVTVTPAPQVSTITTSAGGTIGHTCNSHSAAAAAAAHSSIKSNSVGGGGRTKHVSEMDAKWTTQDSALSNKASGKSTPQGLVRKYCRPEI